MIVSKVTRFMLAPLAVALMVLVNAGCQSNNTAADLDWPTSLPQALAKAKSDNKLVLVNFTGSDSCPGCIHLSKKVLLTKEFEDYADKNLELVVVDFPEGKKQPEELKNANVALAKEFGVVGYPTILLLDADGKVLNKDEGYAGAKPAEFIAGLEKARKKG
jgi:protein disulfide-isomerase